MEIIEETTALGVPFCHFRTISQRNQYNLTYTKTDKPNVFEVHLIPLLIHDANGRISYDKDLREFICNKIFKFKQDHNCELYFNINCVGLSNEFLVWKFLRWLKYFNKKIVAEIKITEDIPNSIRFFEFNIR